MANLRPWSMGRSAALVGHRYERRIDRKAAGCLGSPLMATLCASSMAGRSMLEARRRDRRGVAINAVGHRRPERMSWAAVISRLYARGSTTDQTLFSAASFHIVSMSTTRPFQCKLDRRMSTGSRLNLRGQPPANRTSSRPDSSNVSTLSPASVERQSHGLRERHPLDSDSGSQSASDLCVSALCETCSIAGMMTSMKRLQTAPTID